MGLRQRRTVAGDRLPISRLLEEQSDTVLAIFAGAPYFIVHDNKSRHWNTPIYAGDPLNVVFFSTASNARR